MNFDFFKTENLIALSSFFAAGASFWVSWLSYRRDSGQLDFYIGMAEIRNGTTLKKEQDVIHFRIVNAGRRPLIVSQIGGDLKWYRLHQLLSRINPKKFQPRAYILDSPIINSSLLQNGRPRLLNEGDFITFYLPLPEANDLLAKIATGSSSIYVFDTIGRKHKAPSGVFKKLSNDFKKSQVDP
ncbi:hypothetical protein D3C87_175550 [compost metagenome]